MANYNSVFTTNNFKVKEGKLLLAKTLAELVSGEDVCYEIDDKDLSVCIFGYGYFGLCPDDLEELEVHTKDGVDCQLVSELRELLSADEFEVFYNNSKEGYLEEEIMKLWQSVLPEGEHIKLIESGNEKLRYVGGFALVITPKGWKSVEFNQMADNLVSEINNQQ